MGSTHRRSKVVHQELKLSTLNPLSKFICHTLGTHLRIQIIRGNTRGRNHITNFILKLLFDTAVEEESNVSVLFGFGDVTLLESLLCDPFGENVIHALGREGNVEGVVGFVLSHGRNVNIFGEGGGEGLVRKDGVVDTKDLGNFADAVGTVVEEEEGIVIWISC